LSSGAFGPVNALFGGVSLSRVAARGRLASVAAAILTLQPGAA
jgi:hypothetical protein